MLINVRVCVNEGPRKAKIHFLRTLNGLKPFCGAKFTSQRQQKQTKIIMEMRNEEEEEASAAEDLTEISFCSKPFSCGNVFGLFTRRFALSSREHTSNCDIYY